MNRSCPLKLCCVLAMLLASPALLAATLSTAHLTPFGSPPGLQYEQHDSTLWTGSDQVKATQSTYALNAAYRSSSSTPPTLVQTTWTSDTNRLMDSKHAAYLGPNSSHYVLLMILLAAVIRNRWIVKQLKLKQASERSLLEMTDRLRTGVFQVRTRQDSPAIQEFTNEFMRDLSRVDSGNEEEATSKFFRFVHRDDYDRVVSAHAKAVQTGTEFRETFRFQFPDGHWGWIKADTNTCQNEDGSITWSGNIVDLSTEQALNEKLNESLTAREQFVYTAGHELRAPLQSAILAHEALENEYLGVRQRNLAVTARRALQSVSTLVEDLLDLSKIDQDSLALFDRATDLPQLLHEVSASFELSATKKNIQLVTAIPDNLPNCVWVDPIRLKQVLANLLSNAVKYTDQGRIDLKASVTDDDRDDGKPDRFKLVVAVEDTGVGIPPDRLDEIFEPFSTVSSTHRESTGLGLALSRHITQLMGGRLDVVSTVGVGSKFELVLPLEAANLGAPLTNGTLSSPDAQSGSSASQAQENESTSVLIVDDDKLSRVFMKSLLSSLGFHVDDADSAQSALEMCAQNDYAVVVTDFSMPQMDGSEFATHLRKKLLDIEVRPAIIALTAGFGPDTQPNEDVFDAIAVKPMSADALASLIHDVIYRRKSTRTSSNPPRHLTDFER